MIDRLRALIGFVWDRVIRYVLKFGVVGLAGYVTDVGIFNFLRLGFAGEGHFLQQPIGAKIVSVAIATLVTWFGNRYWTFREHRRKNFVLELFEFTVVGVGGLLIGLLCLWISHYLLGFNNIVADNISANVIGLILGTAFRFLLYRYWVYGHHRKDGLTAVEHKTGAATMAIFEDESKASLDAEAPIRLTEPRD
ncbi:MAG: GtrA family protein [Pseudolysinimonas sp.]|uniref:GtrA family protein n=1 Tax=Pseudolysinimonas sp. TaxID=2680009 RepID=UPI0032637266